MYLLFYALNGICSLVYIICFIMVVMAMFKSGDKTLGIVCLVLCWCVGPLIALVTGWINADKWNVRKIMPIFTAAFVGGIIFGVLGGVTAPKNVIVIQQPMQP